MASQDHTTDPHQNASETGSGKSLDETTKQQQHSTDPQEDEKNGNVFGGLFDKLVGDSQGRTDLVDPEDANKSAVDKE